MNDDLEKIKNIFGGISRAKASYEVRASAKYYPNLTRVFVPYAPYSKLIPFMEEKTDDDFAGAEDWASRVIDSAKTSNEDNLERSIRKTKTLISDYVLCNEFELFATFTFNPKKSDRLNPNAVKLQMSNWLKNQRNRNGHFPYLIVPEYHSDKKAIHFHALIRDYTGLLVDSKRRLKGRKVYNFKSYTLGFNSAVKIDNVGKVSNYVKKYITKDMPQFHNQRRFWATKGLLKPRIEDNPSDWYLHETPSRTHTDEYGVYLYFPARKKESYKG